MTTPLETHLRRQHERSRDFFWHRLRWRAVASALPKGRPFTLLDVGAGAGLLADYLGAEFPQATYRFIEPLASLRDELRRRHGAQADATDEQGPLDAQVVTLLDVLEHQEHDVTFLGDLAERLAAGTTLVVTVPALQALWSAWDEMLGHHRRYSRASLSEVLAQTPVDVREVSYLFPEMLPMGLWRRLRARRAKLDENAEFPSLPRWANDALCALGTPTLRLRGLMPLGTSLLAVATRR